MGSEPAPPPGTIEQLHTYLTDTIASGPLSPAERKAAIEALVAEVRIAGERGGPHHRGRSHPRVPKSQGRARRSPAGTAPAPSPEPSRFAQWAIWAANVQIIRWWAGRTIMRTTIL
jgi:hypothetical protein